MVAKSTVDESISLYMTVGRHHASEYRAVGRTENLGEGASSSR